MEALLASDVIGDSSKAALGGLVIGLAYGVLAQSTRFCLRSACLDFWQRPFRRHLSDNSAVWLTVFTSALVGSQLLFLFGYLDTQEVRQLSNTGTLSGAIIGGSLFGVGMVLSRGCAGRLLVLSATGNIRALLAGLVITIIAQASLNGVLSPLHQHITSWWPLAAEQRNLVTMTPEGALIALVLIAIAVPLFLFFRRKDIRLRLLMAFGIGITVMAGWFFTAALSHVSFSPVSPGSITFTGPSANTLMALITAPSIVLDFSLGLVPGVFLGSLASSLIRKEFKIQVFTDETGTLRYLIGGALMGFGGMLAGGCSVGAGITGAGVLSLTAIIALIAMWLSAGASYHLLIKHTSIAP